MQSSMVLLLALSLPLTEADTNSLVCTPTAYFQVQGGEEYERVDCVKERLNNKQCGDQTYALGELQADPSTYTQRRTLPMQDGFEGRVQLTVNRSNGAYKLVVTATIPEDRDWKNVKTFVGTCTNADAEAPASDPSENR